MQTQLFLSYSGTDRTSVAAVQKLLEARGITTFLDHDNLVPGLPWMPALEQALKDVKAVVVFIGPELGYWQKHEIPTLGAAKGYYWIRREYQHDSSAHDCSPPLNRCQVCRDQKWKLSDSELGNLGFHWSPALRLSLALGSQRLTSMTRIALRRADPLRSPGSVSISRRNTCNLSQAQDLLDYFSVAALVRGVQDKHVGSEEPRENPVYFM
jgi:hypothetical protein